MIEVHELSVIALTETWANNSIVHDSMLSINNVFSVFRCDTIGEALGGGVAVLVHKKCHVLSFSLEAALFTDSKLL